MPRTGVFFREPLKPIFPAVADESVLPVRSVSVIITLLNVALTCATPSDSAWIFFFFLVPAAAFAIILNRSGGSPALRCLGKGRNSPTTENLLRCFLLPCYGLAATLAGPGIGARALSTDWKPFPMPKAAVRANIHQPLDCKLHLAACRALYFVIVCDNLTDVRHFVLGQIATFLSSGIPAATSIL